MRKLDGEFAAREISIDSSGCLKSRQKIWFVAVLFVENLYNTGSYGLGMSDALESAEIH